MITLRDYQQRSVNEIWDWFRNNPVGNPLAVLPTGAGKSIICAQLAVDAINFQADKHIRVLVVTHSKELVGQNYEKFCLLAPHIDAGVYSASLNRRDTDNQIIFASIQSVYSKDLGTFDLVIVDECHRIPNTEDGTYRSLIMRLTELQPQLRIIGLTATPYRMKGGLLYKGKHRIFHGIATEVSIKELMDLGHLCRISSWRSAVKADLSSVKISGGDYNITAQSHHMIDSGVTDDAVKDVFEKAAGRQALLVFCVDIEHCEYTAQLFEDHGWETKLVTGTTKSKERDQIIDDFRNGKLRVLVNCEVLTTGFDAPICDAIVMLRGTKSTGLYVQMAGRGMRPFITKNDCLLLDYVGNIETHGCLDDPNIYKTALKTTKGVAPTKYCPECSFILHLAATSCPSCHYQYPERDKKVSRLASEAALLSIDRQRRFEPWMVSQVRPHVHMKNSVCSLRLDYFGYNLEKPHPFHATLPKKACSEWLHPEHSPYQYDKFVQWWRMHMPSFLPVPATCQQATDSITANGMTLERMPSALVLDMSEKYPKIHRKDY